MKISEVLEEAPFEAIWGGMLALNLKRKTPASLNNIMDRGELARHIVELKSRFAENSKQAQLERANLVIDCIATGLAMERANYPFNHPLNTETLMREYLKELPISDESKKGRPEFDFCEGLYRRLSGRFSWLDWCKKSPTYIRLKEDAGICILRNSSVITDVLKNDSLGENQRKVLDELLKATKLVKIHELELAKIEAFKKLIEKATESIQQKWKMLGSRKMRFIPALGSRTPRMPGPSPDYKPVVHNLSLPRLQLPYPEGSRFHIRQS